MSTISFAFGNCSSLFFKKKKKKNFGEFYLAHERVLIQKQEPQKIHILKVFFQVCIWIRCKKRFRSRLSSFWAASFIHSFSFFPFWLPSVGRLSVCLCTSLIPDTVVDSHSLRSPEYFKPSFCLCYSNAGLWFVSLISHRQDRVNNCH